MYPSDSIESLFNFFVNYIMKSGSREFIIIISILVLLYMLFKGSTKREVVVVDQGPRYIPGPVRPVFIRPWGHGGHAGHGGHGGHGGKHHPKPPKIPVIPIKPPKIPIIPIKPIKPPEPFMNNLRPPPPTIPVQPQRWF